MRFKNEQKEKIKRKTKSIFLFLSILADELSKRQQEQI